MPGLVEYVEERLGESVYESQDDSESSDTSISCTVSKLVSESKVSVVATRYNGGMAVYPCCGADSCTAKRVELSQSGDKVKQYDVE